MSKTAALLGIALFFVPSAAALSAQAGTDPVLIIHIEQSGQTADTWYRTSSDVTMRLCTVWDGPMGGKPSSELYQLRRSVKGLKESEQLQFYDSVMSGGGNDSDGYVATMVSIGDGRSRTTVKKKNELQTYEDEPFGRIPASAYCHAFITRTAKGALLHLKGLVGPQTGGDGYFDSVYFANAVMTKKDRDRFLNFEISDAQLANWENLSLSQSGGAPGPAKGDRWEYSVTITARVPDLGELAVEVQDWDNWVPQGNIDDETKSGNEITVKAWVCKTGDPKTKSDKTATITFELVAVGREKGVCANWPTTPGESAARSDLCITEERNPALEQVNLDLEAKTRDAVSETKAVISSFDYAAWGVLKVTAKGKDGKPMKVTYLNKKDIDRITIPKDEDRNRIADAWQDKEGVPGLPADWDEAEVKGQTTKGDGITLYEKYRGFVVSDNGGGKRYTQLKPREKAHFVMDVNDIFDFDRWFTASRIRAYPIRLEWTQNRLVDINRGFGGGHGHWGTLIEEDASPVNESLPKEELSVLRGQWAFSIGDDSKQSWTPQDVELCVVYSGRITYSLRHLRDRMLRALTAPQNDDDREGAAYLLGLGFSKNDLVARLKKISDADLEKLATACVTWAAVHECAHTCGVNGHLDAEGQESADCPSPVPSCPMQYMNWQAKWRLVLFGELGGQGKLCDVEPHHCWRQLSPKD